MMFYATRHEIIFACVHFSTLTLGSLTIIFQYSFYGFKIMIIIIKNTITHTSLPSNLSHPEKDGKYKQKRKKKFRFIWGEKKEIPLYNHLTERRDKNLLVRSSFSFKLAQLNCE